MELFVIFALIWLAFGVAGGMMMSSKGRSGCGGFFLGFVLGPIGLAFALIAPESTERRIEKEEQARERIRAEERQRLEDELRRERGED